MRMHDRASHNVDPEGVPLETTTCTGAPAHPLVVEEIEFKMTTRGSTRRTVLELTGDHPPPTTGDRIGMRKQ